MTCYLRMHEVVAGIRQPQRTIDWDSVLTSWNQSTSVAGRDDAFAAMGVEPFDVYDLPGADLDQLDGLVVSGRVDQELLHRHRDRIRGFLDDGKVVVFSGQLFRPWLPGAGTFEFDAFDDAPLTIAAHPILDGVEYGDLSGSFVYRHGHHPAPEGTETIVSLASGRPAVYIDRVTTAGTILLHGGTNLLAYAVVDSSANRIVPQLLGWIDRERRMKGARERAQ